LKKIKILCFVDYYLPGYKAGGPIRTISNLVEKLGDEFDFYIITRDHDLKSNKCYTDINKKSWNKIGKANVFYLSNKDLFTFKTLRILYKMPHDIIYLNSFFSFYFSGIILFLNNLFKITKSPIIIAPRGEFSPGALLIKKTKKNIYKFLLKKSKSLNMVYWQASNLNEYNNINKFNITNLNRVLIAENITISNNNINSFLTRHPGPLRIIFISRISPMKNLDFLLDVLSLVKAEIVLNICGPKEDLEYWNLCNQYIDKLSPNIKVSYLGLADPNDIGKSFNNHDLFILPTKGENFGHIIFESLNFGVPVIISDRTPWKPDLSGAVTCLPLENKIAWINTIEKWAKFDNHELIQKKEKAHFYSKIFQEKTESITSNRNLFYTINNLNEK